MYLWALSSFPSQHVQYRPSCEVCALQLMNDIPLKGKTHRLSYLQSLSHCSCQFVQTETFCCPESQYLTLEFTTENITHVPFLIIIFIPSLNYWFVVVCPWYWASTPDYNLDFITHVTHHTNYWDYLRFKCFLNISEKTYACKWLDNLYIRGKHYIRKSEIFKNRSNLWKPSFL